MKILFIFSGIFILTFVCFIPLRRHLAEYETQKNGEIVVASIIYIPNCFEHSINPLIEFSYDNKVYSKAIGKSCEEYKIGNMLQLKHTAGTDIFLYTDENLSMEFITTGLLAIFAIFLIVYGIIRNSS